MKNFISIILSVFPLLSFAQSTITYYDQNGNKTGKAKVQYEKPVEPTFKGDYYESSTPNTQLILQGLSARQNLYDNRLNWLLKKYNQINDTRTRLFTLYQTQDSFFATKLADFAKYMNKGNVDLSQNPIFNNLSTYLSDLEDNMFDVYAEIKREEKIKAIEE